MYTCTNTRNRRDRIFLTTCRKFLGNGVPAQERGHLGLRGADSLLWSHSPPRPVTFQEDPQSPGRPTLVFAAPAPGSPLKCSTTLLPNEVQGTGWRQVKPILRAPDVSCSDPRCRGLAGNALGTTHSFCLSPESFQNQTVPGLQVCQLWVCCFHFGVRPWASVCAYF